MAKISVREIAKVIAKKHKMTQKAAENFVVMLFEVINEGLETEKSVKVKGLGTFKVASVKSRESINVNTGERVLIEGHDKISFTPDTAMRDFINKPFAQFETVLINDGVDFTAIDEAHADELKEEADDVTATVTEEQPTEEPVVEQEPVATEEPITEPKLIEEPVVEQEPVATEEPVTEQQPIEEPVVEQEPVITEKPVVTEKLVIEQQPIEQPVAKVEQLVAEPQPAAKEKKSYRSLLVICLVACTALAIGYFLGRKPSTPPADPYEHTASIADTLMEDSSSAQQPAEKTMSASPKEVSASTLAEWNKDSRIRYGAYEIVGIDTVVTLREGQTMKGICHATLGAELIGYFQVVNDSATLKAGKVKVPKLSVRKKK